METMVRFGPQDQLVGVLCEPDPDDGAAGGRGPLLVLPSAGLQPRFGPFRLHVELARRLARSGVRTFRFDVPGVGEAARLNGCGPREATRAALDVLAQRHGEHGFVVGGVCSAADIAWNIAVADPRVRGVLMLDGLSFAGPWFQWAKILGVLRRSPLQWPGVLSRLFRRMQPHERAPVMEDYRDWPTREQAQQQFAGLVQRQVHSLWVYTGGYATTFQHPRQFAWSFGAVTRDPRVTMLFWPDCDHTFFARSHRDRLLDTVDRWLGSAFATPEAA